MCVCYSLVVCAGPLVRTGLTVKLLYSPKPCAPWWRHSTQAGSGTRELVGCNVAAPKLPPEEGRRVNADPSVMAKRGEREAASKDVWRAQSKKWLNDRGRELAEQTPGLFGLAVDGTEVVSAVRTVEAHLKDVSKESNFVRGRVRDWERQVSRKCFKLPKSGTDVLAFCPDLLWKADNLLQNYFEECELPG